MSLWAFQEKLEALGHFYTRYENIDALTFHFSQQLDKLVAGGFIEFEPDNRSFAAPSGNTYEATVSGPGASAQGEGATAVGGRGVYVGGNNSGTVNTGTQIDTGGGAYVGRSVNVGSGNFIGRDKIVQGIPSDELEPLFASLLAAVVQHAPNDEQAAAVQKVRGLEAEAAEGNNADDSRLGRILEGLLEMVPGAIGAAVKMFASPILSGIAGPVTQSVLKKWKSD